MVFEGGLGNQLFQYAAGASIAGVDGVRVLEIRPAPQLALATLVPGLVRVAGPWDLWRLGAPADDAGRVRQRLVRALEPVRADVSERTLRVLGGLDHSFDPRPAHPSRPIVLDGYFQHPDWFAPVEEAMIDRIVKFAPASWREGTFASADTVLHVRGGDYVTLGWMLDEGYYERALELLGPPATVRLVTDDRAVGAEVASVCRRKGWGCSFGPADATAVDDFWTVAAARRVIMSNSTFCWWATKVGDRRWGPRSPGRAVVFPDQWVLGQGAVLRQPTWLKA